MSSDELVNGVRFACKISQPRGPPRPRHKQAQLATCRRTHPCSSLSASSPLKYVLSPPSPPAPSLAAPPAEADADADAPVASAPDAACMVTAGAGSDSWPCTGLVRTGSSFGWCTSRSRPFSDRYRSAASAAMQPEPAAVTACRQCGSCTSPAAKTPAKEVSGVPGLTVIYPTASVARKGLRSAVLGSCPMA